MCQEGRGSSTLTCSAQQFSKGCISYNKRKSANITGCTTLSSLSPSLRPRYLPSASQNTRSARKPSSVYVQLAKWYNVYNYRRAKKKKRKEIMQILKTRGRVLNRICMLSEAGTCLCYLQGESSSRQHPGTRWLELPGPPLLPNQAQSTRWP